MQVLGRCERFDPSDDSAFPDIDAGYWLRPELGPVQVTVDHASEPTELDHAWKDVIRVAPKSTVKIAVPFGTIDPVSNTLLPKCFAGRYMYHCHILEHEDHDMMRHFAVLPAGITQFMGGHGHGH